MPEMDASAAKERQPGPPEREEGFYLDALATGAVLELETQHHSYTLVKGAGSEVLISGHPAFCPEPVAVKIAGSVHGRTFVDPRPGFIGRGMNLVFKHPVFDTVVTSQIREIQKVH